MVLQWFLDNTVSEVLYYIVDKVSYGNSSSVVPVYADQGYPSTNNHVGSRSSFAAWIDSNGHMWVFGGEGVEGILRDLWKWDGEYWTFISNDDPSMPLARMACTSWVLNGSFFLLGGANSDGDSNTGTKYHCQKFTEAFRNVLWYVYV
jgi:hypothetical protein